MKVTIYTVGVETIELEGEEAELLRAAIEADVAEGDNEKISGFLDAYFTSGQAPHRFAMIDGPDGKFVVGISDSDCSEIPEVAAEVAELEEFYGMAEDEDYEDDEAEA